LKHTESDLVCYSDGSIEDNSNETLPAKFSFIVYEKNDVIHKEKSVCDDKFNSTIKAEILGINSCLSFLSSENLQNEKITFFSDSKWVVDFVCNRPYWYSKNTNAPYYKAFVEFRELVYDFTDIEFIWIPRKYNTVADELLR